MSTSNSALPTGTRAKPIVVFCGSVNSSGPVVEQLKKLGGTDVTHVGGGFPALKEAQSRIGVTP